MSDWRDEAACLNDPIPFDDPEPLDRGDVRLRREAQAKEVCWNKCNVRTECLNDALKDETTSMAFHIRGGFSGDERKEILKEQRSERNKKIKREKRLAEKEAVAA